MDIYTQVKNDPDLGPQLLNMLLQKPYIMCDYKEFNKLTKKYKSSSNLDLQKWIEVLSPHEKVVFTYIIAVNMYQKRYKMKSYGPLLPIAKGVSGPVIGTAFLAGSTVVGTLGGLAVGTASVLEEDSGPLTTVIGVGLVGGSWAAFGCIAGATVGSAAAVSSCLVASKRLTWDTVKSVVLWPTTPFDRKKFKNISVIQNILYDLLKMISDDGSFNEIYNSFIETTNNNGLHYLYNFYKEYFSDISIFEFLSAFKNLFVSQKFICNDRVYTSVKVIEQLIRLELGNNTDLDTLSKLSTKTTTSLLDKFRNEIKNSIKLKQWAEDQGVNVRYNTTNNNVFFWPIYFD